LTRSSSPAVRAQHVLRMFVAVGGLLAACAPAPPPRAPSRLPAELAGFLPDPARFASGELARRIGELHRRMLAGEDPQRLLLELPDLSLARPAPPESAAVRLLTAELALVAGDPAAAEEALRGLPGDTWGDADVRLVAGRTAESAGDEVTAVAHYRAAREESAVAAERVRALEPSAAAKLAVRIEEALARGQIDVAETGLRLLASWRTGEMRTLRLELRLAEEQGDRARELRALRALAPSERGDLALELRLAALEVEIGDPGAGVEQLQRLAATHREDRRVAAELRRGKLLFRLANAPEGVRIAARKPELTRAEFARLLYWMVPDVRRSREVAPRIATDLVNHPHREEIVRVANLGLMAVDEALHVFEPDRALRRRDALSAIRRLGERGGGHPCLAGGADPCATAAACGWISDPGECFPGAPVSGAEAVTWILAVVDPAETEP
jgi:hypothetical protein